MSLNDWIPFVQKGLDLTVLEVEELIDVLKQQEDLFIIDDLVYFIDNLHYAVGEFRVVRENFAFVEDLDWSYYVSSEDFNHALDQDRVIISIHHGKKDFAKVIAIVKRKREYLIGTMKQIGRKLIFDPYDRKIYQSVRFVSNLDLSANDRVIGKLLNTNPLSVDVTEVLGQADEPGMDVLTVLFAHDLKTEFDKDVLKEARSIPQTLNKSDYEGRVDHRDQYVITIDGEDAKDLDDAIYLETLANGYRLYVHIADVSYYVSQHSLIDQEAYERTSSIYMVDRVIPMLPKELSNGICSLHPNVDRLAITCQMDIDFNGNVFDYHIYPSVINSKQRLSYEMINAGEDLGDAQEMVQMMLHCAAILNKKRKEEGSIGFDSDESDFVVNTEGKVLDIQRRDRGESEEMIEAFMVLTNEVIAKHVRYQELPILFRVHEEPKKDRLQELSHTLRILGYRMKGRLDKVHPKTLQDALSFFEARDEYPVVSKLVLRSMAKARYDVDALGHFGLALEDYIHFTSPIRRYPDLLLHQRIRKYIFEHDFSEHEFDEKFAKEAAKYVSDKERDIMEAEREVEKMKKAEYMQDKVGEVYIAHISSVQNFGFFVQLDNTVEGLIHIKSLKDDFYHFEPSSQKLIGERSKKEYRIGQRVKVKLQSVDMIDHEVNFKLLEKKRRKHGSRNRKKP